MAIAPALIFLPAFAYLVIDPRVRHPLLICAALFPVLAVIEFFGMLQLILCFTEQPFNLLSWLSFGAILVLMVISIYTGLFLAVFAARM